MEHQHRSKSVNSGGHVLLVAGIVCLSAIHCARAQTMQAAEELGATLPLVSNLPLTGTFYSLTLMQPPFPFNPLPGLPVYQARPGVFVFREPTERTATSTGGDRH